MAARAEAEKEAAEEERSQATHFCVAVRCRPLSEAERSSGDEGAVSFPVPSQLVLRHSGDEHAFSFDHVFSPEATQEQLFETLGQPQLDKAFDGYNGTIFAYGQTGSGKTHTMMGHGAKMEDSGLVPRISEALYKRIGLLTHEHSNRRFLVQCSFLEIYNEVIYDLLVPRAKQTKGGGLEVKESKGIGVYVKDLLEEVVDGPGRLGQLLREGFGNRTTSSTRMNSASSRSHCVFTIKLHQKDVEDSSMNTVSKLSLVDLAGSERAKSTETEGLRLKEGANINKSLSALGNVINALSSSVGAGKKRAFVPYRNSKLTRVLQESFGGNSLCTMVAAVSPAGSMAEETLSTLNYARRAKAIRVSATRNEEEANIRRLEVEMEALRHKLEQETQQAVGPQELQELQDKHRTEIEALQGFMAQSWEDKQRLSEQHEEARRQARREAQKAADQAKRERRRRLELLEQQGDLQLSLQSLAALDGALCSGWQEMIAGVLKAGQHARSQLRAVRLYWASAGADFAALWGCVHEDMGAALLMLGQVRAKLECMMGELDTLASLEVQLQERLGRLTPEVAAALHETREELAEAEPSTSDEAFMAREEVLELLALVHRQLVRYHAKEQTFLREEAAKMGFGAELRRLWQCLAEDGPPPVPLASSPERRALAVELERAAAVAEAAAVGGAEGGNGRAKEETLTQLPWPLGISTLEVPDECLSASSNADAAPSARLLRTGTFGGWCPSADSEREYLEIEVGLQEQRAVAAVSLQGREPCTGRWSQTRELLRLARRPVEGESWSPSDRTFIRPPVRFVYDMAMELIQGRGCLRDGDSAWEVPGRFQRFAEMSQEAKAEFFEELIKRTNDTWADDHVATVNLSPQDILSGRNCAETNRLLQLLAYAALSISGPGLPGGLGTVAPQWTTAWKLEYCTERKGWQWLGGEDAEAASIFDGNTDAQGTCFMALPQALRASRVRLHPVAWHRHAALRCELHLIPLPGADDGEGPRPLPPCASAQLRAGAGLALKGSAALQRELEDKHEERQRLKSALEERAEQERGQQEQRLQDALARAEELEARAVAAETALLRARAENERLGAAVEQLEAELAAGSDAKASSDGRGPLLQQEREDLQATVEELTQRLAVACDERDAARAHEEELFEVLSAKDEELMEAHRSHVDLTQRLQERDLQADTAELMVDELERLNSHVEELQATQEASEQRCRELEAEVARLTAANVALAAEREKLLHKKEKLQAKKEALQKRLDESEQARLAARDRCQRMLERRLTGDTVATVATARPSSRSHREASPAASEREGQRTRRLQPEPSSAASEREDSLPRLSTSASFSTPQWEPSPRSPEPTQSSSSRRR